MTEKLVQSSSDLLKDLDVKTGTAHHQLASSQSQNGLPMANINLDRIRLTLRELIADLDPAYTQLFGADPEKVKALAENFEKIKSGIANQNSDKRNNNLIYLTTMTETYEVGWERIAANNVCKGTQAFVIRIDQMQFYEEMQNTPARYPSAGKGFIPPGNAYMINFCPMFFDAPDLTAKLYDLDQGGKKEDICNLKNLDTTGTYCYETIDRDVRLTLKQREYCYTSGPTFLSLSTQTTKPTRTKNSQWSILRATGKPPCAQLAAT